MAEAPKGKGTAVRILVIDDEAVIKEVLQIAFEEAGWQVMKADTGEEAVRRLRDSEFDVLVVDKNLPGMSGVDFIREVRKHNRVIRVLMITAYGSVESAVETLNLGIDAYLEKPFPNVSDVVRAVKVAMARFDARWFDSAPPEPAARPPPGLLGPRAAQGRSPGRDLTVVVGSPDDQLRSLIASHLDARDRIQLSASAQDVLACVSRDRPDLAVLDASFTTPDIIELIAAIKAATPHTTNVVVADSLPLTTIKRLIDLQVQALIDRSAESGKLRRRLADVLTQLRSTPAPR
ncbi:MAG: response regulator [Deltaproteobacteria bacterium]|nr:response regulator [Deltaproteobacteria bacterium]